MPLLVSVLLAAPAGAATPSPGTTAGPKPSPVSTTAPSGLATPGPRPTKAPSPQASTGGILPTAVPSASATAIVGGSAGPSASPTRAYSPAPSPRVSLSPVVPAASRSPRAASVVPAGTTSPVTGDLPVGSIAGSTELPSPQAAVAAPVTPAAARTSTVDRFTQLIELLLAAAILLGVGGGYGLYATRNRS